MNGSGDVGARFAQLLAAKDWDALTALFADDIDVKAATPGRLWAATTPQSFVDDLLTHWFEPSDHIDALREVESRMVTDRHHVRYQLDVHNDDGRFLVEQQAYYDIGADGRVTRMHLLCGGYRAI